MSLLLVSVLLFALQTRDSAIAPTTGTASLSGIVIDDREPGQPVRRAVVTLTGKALQPGRGAITDDEGRFTLRDLPPGRFTLMAERGGFVTSMYGARRPGRAGTEIALDPGQQIADLRLRLWRGAVLTGVVRDESGEPLANARIAAIPVRQVTPIAMTLSNSALAATNDAGEYRIFGLEPGTYLVGTVIEYSGVAIAASDADIDATFAALAARSRQARPVPTQEARLQPPTTNVSTVPIYFPGTPVAANATAITVKAGEERSGLDFAVHRIPVATIRGRIVAPDGTPAAGAFVQITHESGRVEIPGAPAAPVTATAGADGTFALTPVSPGTYRLLARGNLTTPPGRAGPATSAAWAVTPITVSGSDTDLATLTLQPGLTFSGRVVLDDKATTPPPDLAGLRVELHGESLALAPAGGRGRAGGPNPRFLQPAPVRADGTFEVADLVPDDYRLTLSGGAPSQSAWWVRSAMLYGRDLLDAPLRLAPGEHVRGVTIVLSDRRTELSGTITTAGGAAFSDLFVLAFPADAQLRRPGSRRIQAVRPDSAGRYVLANLPPGEYLLCALGDVDDGQWYEPGFLDPLVAASVKITLAEGEKRVQDLRLGGGHM
jgi:protocatechuate 3,4-dioxygenase beta subunit